MGGFEACRGGEDHLQFDAWRGLQVVLPTPAGLASGGWCEHCDFFRRDPPYLIEVVKHEWVTGPERGGGEASGKASPRIELK